jgi:small subunit ribosomal protein S1
VGTRVEGTISSLTKYGAFVELETGVEGLIHISEMSWTKRLRHPSELLKVGDRVEVAVLSIDKEKQRIGLGYKQTREDPWEKVVTECPEGSAVTGKVVSLTNFGAFVSLAEGVDGMVHVSDLSWGKKVNHPSQVLREGDLVEARVLKIDRENRKISLGLKQARPDPWKEVPDRYPVGTLVGATVTSLTDFGAFAEIEPGLEGLIHISELSADRVEKVSDVLSVGQKITAAVTKIDQEARRIGLSVRAGQEREAVRNQVNIQAEVESEGKSIAAGLSDFGQLLNAALEKDRKGSD